MATTRIEISRAKPHGDNLLTAIAQAKESQDRLYHAKAVMETCIDGADYSLIETVFGAPEGTGQAIYNLVAGAESKIDAADIKTIIARMG